MTDSELIYLTKTENLQHAKEILNDKYLAYLKNLNNKFNTKLYGSWKKDTSENLTKAYMVFDECLSTLESKCAYDFGKKLTLTCKSSLINEIRSYITYKRCLLDKSISIDSNAETDYEDNKQQIQNELLHSYKMQLVNNFLEGKPRVIKLIVKMRRLGFDWREISIRVRRKKKQVQNLFNHFVNSFRHTHKYQIEQLTNN